MISYVMRKPGLGAEPRAKPYGLAGGKPMAFVAPQESWLSRAGIGRKTIKPHCGTRKRQQFSDCTCNMATNLVECVRGQQGLPHVELSATAVYNHINGGRDAGSNLHDAADYVEKVGCVPVSMWPASIWRKAEPAGYADMAAKFRGLEWIDIPSAAGVITGIGWYGKPVGIGVRWGMGGHAIAVVNYDVRTSVPVDHLRAYEELVREFEREDRQLAEVCGKAAAADQIWFEIENSWGTDYGENGFGWLPWSQVDSGVRTRYGGICVTSVTYTVSV